VVCYPEKVVKWINRHDLTKTLVTISQKQKRTRLHLRKMLCHRINTTLNSSVGTFFFFVSIQLKIVIMQRSLTYLIPIIRLVIKSIVNNKRSEQEYINALESSEFGGEGHISHSLNFMTTTKDNTVRHFVKI
jgi:hypothetical protein